MRHNLKLMYIQTTPPHQLKSIAIDDEYECDVERSTANQEVGLISLIGITATTIKAE